MTRQVPRSLRTPRRDQTGSTEQAEHGPKWMAQTSTKARAPPSGESPKTQADAPCGALRNGAAHLGCKRLVPQGYGAAWALTHCWQECKLVLPSSETVCRCICHETKRRFTVQPSNPALSSLRRGTDTSTHKAPTQALPTFGSQKVALPQVNKLVHQDNGSSVKKETPHGKAWRTLTFTLRSETSQSIKACPGPLT